MPRKIDKSHRERLVFQRDRMERAMTRLMKEGDIDTYIKMSTAYRAYLKEIAALPEPKKSKPQEVSESLDAILDTADVKDDSEGTEDN